MDNPFRRGLESSEDPEQLEYQAQEARKEARQELYGKIADSDATGREDLEASYCDFLASHLAMEEGQVWELSESLVREDRNPIDLYVQLCDQLVTHPKTLLGFEERQVVLHEARQNIHSFMTKGEGFTWIEKQAMKLGTYDEMQSYFHKRAGQLREDLADPLFPEVYRPTTETALRAIETSATPKYFPKIIRPEEE